MKGGLSPPHGNSPPFQKNVSRETSVTNVSRETYILTLADGCHHLRAELFEVADLSPRLAEAYPCPF